VQIELLERLLPVEEERDDHLAHMELARICLLASTPADVAG
jgi:hypothetical protein